VGEPWQGRLQRAYPGGFVSCDLEFGRSAIFALSALALSALQCVTLGLGEVLSALLRWNPMAQLLRGQKMALNN
jgi:hypothetical protein